MAGEALRAYRDTLTALGWSQPEPRPGLGRKEIEQALRDAGIAPIEPVVSLYETMNGADHGHLFSFAFNSLADALAKRLTNLGFNEPEDSDPAYLPHYLPVVEHDPSLVVDTTDPAGRVLAVWWDSPTQVEYESLRAFVDAQREKVENGEVEYVDGVVRVPPPKTAPRPRSVVTFSYLAGRSNPTNSTRELVQMLPDFFAKSGATSFRVESLPRGGLAGNENLEPEQTANLQSLIAEASGLDAYTLRWELRPAPTPFIGPRHYIEIYVDD